MDYEQMRKYADELAAHAPDPFRGYEISGDEIIMMMSPSRPHEFIALRVRQQLDRQLPTHLVAHTGGEVEDPSIGRLRRPDLLVVPDEVFAEDTMAPFHPRDVALVAEIVSPSNHSTDYVEKMHDYPAMGIPLCLLVDPRKGTLAALSDPGPDPACEGSRYRTRSDYAFGDTVTIGDWVIETGDLHRYPGDR
ncbi:Uma2 family endonuclease [Streptomyces sp. N2-109]|uniref:Uma2 family endonuclease n=1 Tax=Streptomyces gossypii TaxID=2883101 RepID=A0ABT2JVR6_9ACTN|nr:Uma2 family endonuclease [Streptomyces gossypii]MCT2592003.1 Uma2 family endonuclease [Streptomyces gossypii]